MTRNEDGFVAGAEGMAFGVLVFVIGLLVVVQGWSVIDARAATGAAAREAARTFVESDDPDSAWTDAQDAAREAMTGYGRDGDELRFVNEPPVLTRCERVTVVVEYDVAGLTVTGRHSEIVDPYRSALEDRSECD